ncbi:MAG TPA: hypothetical protein VHO84_12315 [Syntrophorhabdaceae bacterium]|nr:hypothetical protein [Syntrophorhabdaceae bacterium]
MIPMFKLSLWNAWLLSVPFVVLAFLIMGTKKGIARRMSDMTGYSGKETFSTIAASLARYWPKSGCAETNMEWSLTSA